MIEGSRLPDLQRGEGLWRVRQRAFAVRHLVTDGSCNCSTGSRACSAWRLREAEMMSIGLATVRRGWSPRRTRFKGPGKSGPLSPDDARSALVVPAQSQGVEFDEDALAVALAEAHGYPYFLQEGGSQLWNTAESSPITAEDARRAKPKITEHLDRNFFRMRFDRLTPKEKEYLWAMARLGPGPHRSGDIAAQLGVRVESVAPRRGALIAKGMIYSPGHGDTAFTVPLFDEFMNRARQ